MAADCFCPLQTAACCSKRRSPSCHTAVVTGLRLIHLHIVCSVVGSSKVFRTATTPSASVGVRLPPGHPEGFLEAFANVYAEFYGALSGSAGEFPGVQAGAEGVRFVERVVESSRLGGVWVNW